MIGQNPPVPQRYIEQAILLIRGHRVMLSTDLAALYGVPVHRLNEQVKRNRQRFPEDFMFQLSPDEWSNFLEAVRNDQNTDTTARLSVPMSEAHDLITAAGFRQSARTGRATFYVDASGRGVELLACCPRVCNACYQEMATVRVTSDGYVRPCMLWNDDLLRIPGRVTVAQATALLSRAAATVREGRGSLWLHENQLFL